MLDEHQIHLFSSLELSGGQRHTSATATVRSRAEGEDAGCVADEYLAELPRRIAT